MIHYTSKKIANFTSAIKYFMRNDCTLEIRIEKEKLRIDDLLKSINHIKFLLERSIRTREENELEIAWAKVTSSLIILKQNSEDDANFKIKTELERESLEVDYGPNNSGNKQQNI